MQTSTAREVPNRIRGAGLLMLFGSIIWIVMPVAIALGADLSRGIGVSLGTGPALAVYPATLLWLTPLSLVTSVSGLLLYYGRALAFGIVVALVWVAIGLAASVQVAVVAGFVAYAILTGKRRLAPAAAVEG